MVKLSHIGGGGSTQKKLLKAIFLMSFIYNNVYLLYVKPAHEKIKGWYKKMCLKINFSLNGVFLLNIFYLKNTGLKKIARLT
jgi:hypothetical protein